MAAGNGQESTSVKNCKFIALLAAVPFILSAQETNSPVILSDSEESEFVSLFEKVELEELPPADEYYIDD